ncbi:MAG: hemerythrin family protein [Ghiorsea sp.]|nr:hemerythrin family protein [Ghiorsea sp.]
MGFQWDDKYSTGNTEIDNQHKQIFAYLDELEERIENGASQKWVQNFMDALGLYTRSHFCYEEICMRQAKCSVAAKNKDQHAKLLAAFSKAAKRFEREGVSDELLAQLQAFLTSWLVNHIMKIDIHLNECNK